MRLTLSSHCQPQPPARLSLRAALALWRSRRALAALSADHLCDVGITAQEARQEAARPFWDAPASWKD